MEIKACRELPLSWLLSSELKTSTLNLKVSKITGNYCNYLLIFIPFESGLAAPGHPSDADTKPSSHPND